MMNVILIGCLIFTSLLCIGCFIYIYILRKKVSSFANEICDNIEGMINGIPLIPVTKEEETLLSKINFHLVRLYETMQENNRRVTVEKVALQELISDISHQVKTPVTNLKMLNSTLCWQDIPDEKRREFLLSASSQIEKLDFLMQAMIKMSRLETGIITLSPKENSVHETLALALGGILLSAEKKNISVNIDCPEDIKVLHDRKWTAEALFNILDNAVKYTPEGGFISISCVFMELQTKIEIKDTGKGIPENHQTDIFKRFYREEDNHDIEGIGIGLYLAREIISLQGGYLKVSSEPGSGSIFSIFLPNK